MTYRVWGGMTYRVRAYGADGSHEWTRITSQPEELAAICRAWEEASLKLNGERLTIQESTSWPARGWLLKYEIERG